MINENILLLLKIKYSNTPVKNFQVRKTLHFNWCVLCENAIGDVIYYIGLGSNTPEEAWENALEQESIYDQ